MIRPSCSMKMLCSGSDLAKLELLKKRLIGIGVACELRQDFENVTGTDAHFEVPSYPELWVQQDEDLPLASIILTSPGAVGGDLRAM